jgi:hypothetical protein
VKPFIAFALASALALAGCYAGPGANQFVTVLDELDVPAGWEAAQTELRGPGEAAECDPMLSTTCPAAIRTYATPVDSVTAWDQVAEALQSAGFELTTEARSSCPSDWCGLIASRGTDTIMVTVLPSISEAGIEGDYPDGAAVQINAHGSD